VKKIHDMKDCRINAPNVSVKRQKKVHDEFIKAWEWRNLMLTIKTPVY